MHGPEIADGTRSVIPILQSVQGIVGHMNLGDGQGDWALIHKRALEVLEQNGNDKNGDDSASGGVRMTDNGAALVSGSNPDELDGIGASAASPVETPRRGGRPTRAQALTIRAAKAAARFDAEVVPAALERIGRMLSDPSTPASVVPQLLMSAEALRARLPDAPPPPENSTDLEARLAKMEEILYLLERRLPPEGNRDGRPGAFPTPRGGDEAV